MSRVITLRATFDELFGDETYELWLKHESDAWTLHHADVVVLTSGHMDLELDEMIEGDDYIAQVRLLRDGRYRLPYQPLDPGVWPASSRVAFTVGALTTVGAPVLSLGAWSRTSGVSQRITLTVTPEDAAVDLDLYRDGVVIHTFAGGSIVGSEVYVDLEPPIGAAHVYTAKHRSGTLSGPASNELTVFAGPAVPTAVVQSSSTSAFGSYTVTWNGAGSSCRFQDDFLCPLTYREVVVTGAGTRTEVLEMDVIPVGPTQTATFRGRVRREVVTFGVTDVSDWVTINIACLIYEANTAYQSCP